MNHGVLSIVYGVVALLSMLLFVGYCLFDKKKNRLFLSLFGCIAASNCGYFLLSICTSLTVAKFANAISYLGGAFSMLVMLLISLADDFLQLRDKHSQADDRLDKLLQSLKENGMESGSGDMPPAGI